jgi:hypothetical protein
VNIKAWLKVIALGPTKFIFKFLALIAYPFIDKINNPIFGVRDASDLSYYNIAFRNGAHNLYNRPDVPHTTVANTEDFTLEKEKGFQWRLRQSLDKEYVSFRMTWGKPRPTKGKREFYIGWTMGSGNLKGEARMRLTFFQFRPW